MRAEYRAKLLEIHCAGSDRYEGKALYAAIVDRCKALGVAGATVFQGLEGYGETGEIHRRSLMHANEPLVITIVDTPERIGRLAAEVEPMLDTGFLSVFEVRAVRVEKEPEATLGSGL